MSFVCTECKWRVDGVDFLTLPCQQYSTHVSRWMGLCSFRRCSPIVPFVRLCHDEMQGDVFISLDHASPQKPSHAARSRKTIDHPQAALQNLHAQWPLVFGEIQNVDRFYGKLFHVFLSLQKLYNILLTE